MALWNGNQAALSITFDDGLACQIQHAIPIMTKRRVPGTFFLIEKAGAGYPAFDEKVWKPVVESGHEVGSHSATHVKAATLGPGGFKYEAESSKSFLESRLGIPINSYCYPYTDAPAPYQQAVRSAGYKQARGGRVARVDKFITRDDGVNLFNTPCYHINSGEVQNIPTILAAALWRKAWVTLMLHGVGPDGSQWDNVFPDDFDKLLDHVCRAREQGLWVTTYGNAAESLRANQK